MSSKRDRNTDTSAYATSTDETRKHIMTVMFMLGNCITDMVKRQQNHDQSKLQVPEVDTFHVYTAKLKGCTYGSPEYKQFLEEMKPALDHHYAKNSHHPEFYENGIEGMNLFDLVEMVVDWIAAGMRHADGNFENSVKVNTDRFGLSPQLVKVILNTYEYMRDNEMIVRSN